MRPSWVYRREYKRLWHVGVVVGQGVRPGPLRGCVEEGFIDVEKQHAEDDEVDLSPDALESLAGYLRVRHANVARPCRHLSIELASGL